MRPYRTHLVALILLCISLVLFAGCTTAPMGEQRLSPHEAGAPPPFGELWTIAVEETGIDNQTAELERFNVGLYKNLSIEYFFMDFRGMKEGKPQRCRVDAYSSGRIQAECISEKEGLQREESQIPSGTHPLTVLSALEKYPYQSSNLSGNRVSIGSWGACCDIMDHNRCAALVELDNSTLIPMEQVIFHLSNEYVYPIHLHSRQYTEDSSGTSFTMDDVYSETLFLPGDLAKASTVKYLPEVINAGLRRNRSTGDEEPVVFGGCGGGSGGVGGGGSYGGGIDLFGASGDSAIVDHILPLFR